MWGEELAVYKIIGKSASIGFGRIAGKVNIKTGNKVLDVV